MKTPGDLAIHGASPAFSEPLHVGRPNIGDRGRFKQLVDDIFDRRWLTNDGPLVRELERRICEELQVGHCVAVNNGTIGLELVFQALGLSGEVILPSFTFIATANALQRMGITPVFADIDPDTHNLDPEAVRRLINPRTRGIVAVHLWGRPAPVVELQKIADEHGLKLVLDAAHAFWNTLGGVPIGRFGDAEVLSFHATKFFNTSEGGAIVTNDDALARELRLLRNFGFSGYDVTETCGTNGKMTEFSAAMGLVNLDVLGDVVEVNRRNHEAYAAAFSRIDGVELVSYDSSERNNYQYVIAQLTDAFPVGRDRVIEVMHAENVLLRRYFWPGCHRMMPYRELYPDAGRRLSATEALSGRVIAFPTGTALPEGAIEVQASILDVLSRNGE